MTQLLLLFVFLFFGLGLSSFVLGRPRSDQLAKTLNRWVIRAALPAFVVLKIHALPEISFSSPEVLLPILQPWIHFFVSLAIVTVLARWLRWSRMTWAALVLTIGLGNTSFVGFPLLRAILGPESLGSAVLLDQLGSFLIFSAIAAPMARMISPLEGDGSSARKKSSIPRLLLRPLRFPPFIALLLALVTAKIEFPSALVSVLAAVSLTLAPAALVSVGLSLKWGALRRREVRQPLAIGLVLKLLVLPAFYFLLYSKWAGIYPGFPPLVLQTILLEGAMASMINAGVIATEYGLEPELAQLMVGVSIPISLVTVPLW